MKIFLTKAAAFSGLFLLPLFLLAQSFSPSHFYEGELVLEDGTELNGLLSYDMSSDAVVLDRGDGKQHSYHAYQIHHFRFEDNKIKALRTFYALPIANASTYESIRLFEVLYEGQLTLLARERMPVTETTENQEAADSQRALDSRLEMPFEFYFLKDGGTLTRFNPGQSKLLNFMDWRYREVKKYMRKHKLKEEYIADLVRITAYYNALEDQ